MYLGHRVLNLPTTPDSLSHRPTGTYTGKLSIKNMNIDSCRGSGGFIVLALAYVCLTEIGHRKTPTDPLKYFRYTMVGHGVCSGDQIKTLN